MEGHNCVDLAFISHGHNDHGNGIKTFLQLNSTSPIYIHKNAFDAHSARIAFFHADIGLDRTLLESSQPVLTDENTEHIEEGLELFSAIKGSKLMPPSNKRLYAKENGIRAQDDFKHEQHLVITDNKNTVLICGCAHKGIINIIEEFKAKKGFYPSHVVGGLHLKKARKKFLKNLSVHLIASKIKFYTCHCTGLKSYSLLKELMNEQIEYISAGSILEIKDF